MKYILALACVLFLAGCCNGMGPGPRASADSENTPLSEETV